MRNQSENQIKLVLIRHGATKANQEHRYLGHTDLPLCEAGKEMLRSFEKSQRYPQVDMLFSSPMQRCIETARILYPAQSPITVSEWMEMDFGAFEMKNYEELKEDIRYQAWIDAGGRGTFPEGESREDFIERCLCGFERICTRMIEEKKSSVGAVVHGGTIMALLSRWTGGEYFDYQVQNGAGYECLLEISQAHWKLLEFKKI